MLCTAKYCNSLENRPRTVVLITRGQQLFSKKLNVKVNIFGTKFEFLVENGVQICSWTLKIADFFSVIGTKLQFVNIQDYLSLPTISVSSTWQKIFRAYPITTLKALT